MSEINETHTLYSAGKNYPRLMFITHRTARFTEYDEASAALQGGCRWIQLRMKENPDIATARSLVRLCRESFPDAVVCIDDQVEMAYDSGAGAVHLGKNDWPVRQAWDFIRQTGGTSSFQVGATANTFEDIRQAVADGASYIGLGPYRFTETKKKLSPVLGLEGYRKIVRQCRDANLQIPIFAIGGILLEDVGPLMETGLTGIAISGAIIQASDPVEQTRRFMNELNKY